MTVLGHPFEILSADVCEDRLPLELPGDMVIRLAVAKASRVAESNTDALVIGADTAVVIDEEILGKPATDSEAHDMLRRLSNRTHEVLTGLGLVWRDANRIVTHVERTRVRFGPLTSDQIEAYIATGSSFDKAGAYGIQDDKGCLFIESITGDYNNVMGLPLFRLNRLLEQYGYGNSLGRF